VLADDISGITGCSARPSSRRHIKTRQSKAWARLLREPSGQRNDDDPEKQTGVLRSLPQQCRSDHRLASRRDKKIRGRTAQIPPPTVSISPRRRRSIKHPSDLGQTPAKRGEFVREETWRMSDQVVLPLLALVAVVALVLLITRLRVHPFIALALAALFLGLAAGMPLAKVIKAFQTGFGGVLGFVGIVLALGTMLGKMMAESGGADQIAKALLGAFGRERVHWAMMFVASIVAFRCSSRSVSCC
jgi:hypothetical protein